MKKNDLTRPLNKTKVNDLHLRQVYCNIFHYKHGEKLKLLASLTSYVTGTKSGWCMVCYNLKQE